MLHIVKTKTGKFQVVFVAKNGEPLSTSELLNTKQSAFKNAISQISLSMSCYPFVQDDTGVTPMIYTIQGSKKHLSDDLPLYPKYIAGKNPKKKK